VHIRTGPIAFICMLKRMYAPFESGFGPASPISWYPPLGRVLDFHGSPED